MIGSMFVGLLIGLLAGAITNRGERYGMLWEDVSRLDWCLFRTITLWFLGAKPKWYSHYPSSSRCHDCVSYFLGKRKLTSRL